ncbi:MAG: hypothetical protein PVI87_05640 [Gammaproteobacteria bacterium]|jgi:hypothetical protein
MKGKIIVLLGALVLVAACGERPEPPPVEDTVFADQVEALDKARAVEEEAEKRKREIDQQLDRDSGGGN